MKVLPAVIVLFCAMLLGLFPSPGQAAQGDIATFAGGGVRDGSNPLLASLLYPAGAAVDSTGNLYIADQGNNRIRRIDAGTGAISTVAGTEPGGFAGDGGLATVALLSAPTGVALDSTGTILYIADQGNNRIRMVTGGFISTVAGNGTAGFAGDAGAATSAN
jgi:trimeric autotransporter adhesin